jgi:hypothetical protein
MRHISYLIILAVLGGAMLFPSCELEDQTPTKTSMEGVWEVTQAFNADGELINDIVNFPVTAFYLSSDNTMLSTGGPLFMYMVYGPSQYTAIASQIDQVFNYTTLTFNGGEFFVGPAQQERFTLEIKLEGLPGLKTLNTLLELIGIQQSWLSVVVYHKFMDVSVNFSKDMNTMIWEFDSQTFAVYNTKDQYGNYVLWEGWPVDNFHRCKLVMVKRSQDLRDVVQNASQ